MSAEPVVEVRPAFGTVAGQPFTVESLRENADIREALLERGNVKAETLDALFLYSHDQLDRLAEDDLLEETAVHVSHFQARLRPSKRRDSLERPGRYEETVRAVLGLQEAAETPLGGQVKVSQAVGGFEVAQAGAVVHRTGDAEDAARVAVERELMVAERVYRDRRRELSRRAAKRS